ncbi:MAG: hypothetical protein ACI4OL_06865 [Gemmiger sp.]
MLKKMYEQRTKLLCLLAALAMLGLWFWGARAKDVYHAEPGDAGYAEGYDPADCAGWQAGQQVAEGYALHDLYPGTYRYTIRYQAGGAGGGFTLYDRERNCTLAQGVYDPGAGAVTVLVELEGYTSELLVRSTLGDGALELLGCTVESDGPLYTDAWWTLALLMLAAAFFAWCVRRMRAGSPRNLQLFLLAGVFSLPYLTDHLPYGMDLEFHISRLYGIASGLAMGQFPVRLNFDFLNGAGYISSIMYPELFFYPSGVLCALGASVLFGMKVLLIFIVFATVYTSYYAMREMLGDKAALIFTLLYLCCPYRLNDVYTRAALGEALAMAFLPLAAVGIWQLAQGDYKKGFWMAAAGITCVLQSHVISAFLVVLFGVLYAVAVLLADGRRFFADLRRLGAIVAAAVATVLANLWFLVPFLHYSGWDLHIFHEEGYLDTANIYLWQAFMDSYTTWGDNYDKTTTGEMPLSVGLAALLGVVLFLWFVLRRDPDTLPRRGIGLGCLGLGTVALLMASNLFPWAQLQQYALVQATFCKMQFAWRTLMVVSVLYTAVTALAVEELLRRNRQAAAGVVVTVAVLAALSAGSGYLFTNATTLDSSSADWNRGWVYGGQYLLAGTDAGAVGYQASQVGVRTRSNAQVLDYDRDNTTLRFSFTSDGTGAQFRLPLYFYDLYEATLDDGTRLALGPDDNYQMLQVTVPAGIASGTVTVRYHKPLRFAAAELVSAASLAGLAVLYVFTRKRRRTARP